MSAITVSEETLKRVLAEFKLELMQDLRNYATTASLAPIYAKQDDNARRIGEVEKSVAGFTAVSTFARVLWPALAIVAVGAIGVLVTLVVRGG